MRLQRVGEMPNGKLMMLSFSSWQVWVIIFYPTPPPPPPPPTLPVCLSFDQVSNCFAWLFQSFALVTFGQHSRFAFFVYFFLLSFPQQQQQQVEDLIRAESDLNLWPKRYVV